MDRTYHFSITLPYATNESRRLPDIQYLRQSVQDIDLVLKNISDGKVNLSDYNTTLATLVNNTSLTTALLGKAEANHTHTKGDVGLSNVDNTSDASKPISAATQAALANKVNSNLIGANNGIAQLDANGKVPADQLPSYVDDIVEAANFGLLPISGESGKIYVTTDDNLTFRWSGSQYVQIGSSGNGSVSSVAGKTGIVTLTKSDVGLGNVDNTADINKPVSNATQAAIDTARNTAIAASTPVAHAGAGGTAHSLVNTTTAGFMSAADKNKLDAITGVNTGDQTDIPGNAATATKLQAVRMINGVSFDGTSDITINAVDATPRIGTSLLGAANGVAQLDAGGKVPASQLKSAMDYREFNTNITLALTDSGAMVKHQKADISSRSVTVPTQATVPFEIGTTVIIMNPKGAGSVTIAPAGGVTINLENSSLTGTRTLAPNNKAVLFLTDANEWTLSGNGLT